VQSILAQTPAGASAQETLMKESLYAICATANTTVVLLRQTDFAVLVRETSALPTGRTAREEKAKMDAKVTKKITPAALIQVW
tara:strand:- start:506 stop:754 length:249 start_codon:yes stop_codon:yes gene_type:complete